MGWDAVEDAVEDAVGQAWDGCHKIYLLMDEDACEEQRGYGYDVVEPDLDQLHEWFEDSCGLRFINSIKSPGQNADFKTLIAQFEEDDEDDEEELGESW